MEIEILRRHGVSLRKIAEAVGCAVNTVRSYLKTKAKPVYRRKVRPVTKLAPYQEYLKARQQAAKPHWIPATVLLREIKEQGYAGGITQLRSYLFTLKPSLPVDPVVRFETEPGEQMQVDWVEFRKGTDPLYAFCATLGFSRISFVVFVTNMKIETLIDCHEKAFAAFGGIPRQGLYDNMKTVVIERDIDGEGAHRFHAGFLDYAKHCGFVIKLCRPYRAKTKGKVERFNGYLRRSFYVPLVAKLKQSGLVLDVVTANIEVGHWLNTVANERLHGTTQMKPKDRLLEENLQPLPTPWRGDIVAARPQKVVTQQRPIEVRERLAMAVPQQHPLATYDRLFNGATL